MSIYPASKKQKDLVSEIVKTLKMKDFDPTIFRSQKMTSEFIKYFMDDFKKVSYSNKNEEKRNFILKNLSFIEMLELLGYEKIKEKSCLTYPQYRLGEDVVTCRINSKQNPNDLEYYFYFKVKNLNTPTFEVKGLNRLEEPREQYEKQGGDVIGFMVERLPNYNYYDILNMLYNIAQDRNNATKYGFDAEVLKGKSYALPNEITRNNDRYNIWSADYRKQKGNIIPPNTKVRGLDINDDILEFSKKGSSKPIKITSVPNATFGENTGYTTDQSNNNGLYILSYPSYAIEKNGGRYELKMVGDQTAYIITQDFFSLVRKNMETYSKRLEKKGSFFRENLNQEAKEKITKTIEKLGKMSIPSDLKSDLAFVVMNKMLQTKIFINNKNIYTLPDLQKRMRKGSRKSASILGTPSLNNNNQNLLIVENPVFDGLSAIKLGYLPRDGTMIMGTLGNPSQDFFDTTKSYLENGGIKIFKNIVLATDRDEAGEKFYFECKDKIAKIYSDILLENRALKRLAIDDFTNDFKNRTPNFPNKETLTFSSYEEISKFASYLLDRAKDKTKPWIKTLLYYRDKDFSLDTFEKINSFSHYMLNEKKGELDDDLKSILTTTSQVRLDRLLPKGKNFKDLNEELVYRQKNGENISENKNNNLIQERKNKI